MFCLHTDLKLKGKPKHGGKSIITPPVSGQLQEEAPHPPAPGVLNASPAVGDQNPEGAPQIPVSVDQEEAPHPPHVPAPGVLNASPAVGDQNPEGAPQIPVSVDQEEAPHPPHVPAPGVLDASPAVGDKKQKDAPPAAGGKKQEDAPPAAGGKKQEDEPPAAPDEFVEPEVVDLAALPDIPTLAPVRNSPSSVATPRRRSGRKRRPVVLTSESEPDNESPEIIGVPTLLSNKTYILNAYLGHKMKKPRSTTLAWYLYQTLSFSIGSGDQVTLQAGKVAT